MEKVGYVPTAFFPDHVHAGDELLPDECVYTLPTGDMCGVQLQTSIEPAGA